MFKLEKILKEYHEICFLILIQSGTLLGQGIRRSPPMAKNLPPTRKIYPLDSPTKFLSPSTKYQLPRFNPPKTSFLAF